MLIRSFIRIVVAITLISSSLMSHSFAKESNEEINRIIAIVGDEVITESDLNEVSKVIMYINKIPSEALDDPMLKQQILRKMITDAVQTQFAKSRNIDVSSQDLDNSIVNFRKRNSWTEQEFMDELKSNDIKISSFKNNFENEIILDKLHHHTVNRDIHVSENEIDMFLKSSVGKESSEVEYKIGHILIPKDNDSNANIKFGKSGAMDVLTKLQSGAKFSTLANKHSQSSTALKGGDLGWRKIAEVPSIFSKALLEMDKGQISDIIENDSGYHIIQLQGIKNNEGSTKENKYSLQQILMIPSENVSQNKVNKKLTMIKKKLDKGTDFSTMAKENSDEKSTAFKGGSTGWVTENDLAKDFYSKIKELQIGDISEPFKTEKGWYVVKMVDKKQVVNESNKTKEYATNMISRRKSFEKLEFFIRSLKSRTNIEILDEQYA